MPVSQGLIETSILDNWQIASEQRRDEIDLVYYKLDVFDNVQGVGELLVGLPLDEISADN